jgi:hypothetical protein
VGAEADHPATAHDRFRRAVDGKADLPTCASSECALGGGASPARVGLSCVVGDRGEPTGSVGLKRAGRGRADLPTTAGLRLAGRGRADLPVTAVLTFVEPLSEELSVGGALVGGAPVDGGGSEARLAEAAPLIMILAMGCDIAIVGTPRHTRWRRRRGEIGEELKKRRGQRDWRRGGLEETLRRGNDATTLCQWLCSLIIK